MDEKIELEVKYTVDDYVRSSSFVQKHTFFSRYGFIIFPAIAFFSLVLYSFFVTKSSARGNQPFLQTALVIFIICFLIFCVLLAIRFLPNPFVRWNLSRQINSAPTAQQTQQVLFDDDGINIQNLLGSGEAKWGAIIEVVESKEDFYFYTAKKFAMFVPKRCFSSEEQQNQLRELVKRKLGDKAKLMNSFER